MKRFFHLLSLCGAASSAPTLPPVTASAGSVLLSPLIPTQSVPVEEREKKKWKKSTTKKARTKVTPSPDWGKVPSSSATQFWYYGINMVKEQAQTESPPHM